MKDKFVKGSLLDGEKQINIDSIKMQKSTHAQRIFDQFSNQIRLQGGYAINSASISEAIMGKTVIKDDENKRILGVTDNEVIEFDKNIIAGITLATQNILKKFKEKVENGTVRYPNIIETLTYIEFTNAAFVETPEFEEVKSELNKILANFMKNGSYEEIQMTREGLLGFFQNSKNNIVRGRKKFKNLPYSIENAKEKEFLRAIFIAEMYEAEVFDFEFLELAGEFDDMEFDIIDEIYRRSDLFTPEQVEKALLLSGKFNSRDEILEYYFENDRRYFINFTTISELAKYIADGKIMPRDAIKRIKVENIKDLSPELLEEFLQVSNFPKGVDFIDYIQVNGKYEKFLSKKLLKELDREQFLKVIASEKIARAYQNSYTSEDYIDEYGKLNVDDIMRLEADGKIEGEELIKLTKFKSIQIQNPEEYKNLIENLVNYYDLEKLNSLYEKGKINSNFSMLYNEFIENMLTEEERKNYFDKMQKDLEDNKNSDKALVNLVKAGLNIGKKLEYEIPEEYIAEAYLEDEISEEDMMRLYKDRLISLKTIRVLYSDPDLIEKYKKGLLDYKILNILENRADFIREELKAGNLTAQQLMDLYSENKGIEMSEFAEITEGYEFPDEILAEYLSDEITPKKVEALFTNYYISQDDLSVLVARNIITKEQAEEFATKIATHEQYESLFSLDNNYILLTRETEGGNGGGGYHRNGEGPKRPGQIKNDPELQELLLSQIGFDERTLMLQGTNNSLDGYKIYPSENYGIMIFLKNDKPGNATYIMTLQQGLYFLNKIVRERKNQYGQTEYGIQLQSDATKSELRETEHVKVRNASAGWGANIVEAMKKLSPDFRARVRGDIEYKKTIDDVIEEIREDYKERKERE